MNIFKIGDTDFGIGEVDLKIENGIISNLMITCSKDVHEQITSDENGIWYLTAGYPIKVYFREIPLNNGEIEITEELLDEYDIALYLNEHNDIYGTLTIDDKYIKVKGEAHLWGNTYPLEVIVENTKQAMTINEAKELIKCHAFAHENPDDPRMITGFLGTLRPFQGILKDDNFHELMQCLKALAPEFEARKIEQEVVSALWGICHFGRAWALYKQGMLQHNKLITEEQIEVLDIWISIISYSVANLLQCDIDEAFWEYDEYLLKHNARHTWAK